MAEVSGLVMVRKGKGAGSRTHSRSAISLSDDFGTPPEVCAMVYQFFGGKPDLDPCTGPTAVMQAERMWSAGGLHRPWCDEVEEGRVSTRWRSAYVNPPYSRLGAWMEKVVAECNRFPMLEAVCLVPGSTSASWWKSFVSRRATAVACTKRLSFLGPEGMKAGETCRFHPALVLYSNREGAVGQFEKAFESITTWFVAQRREMVAMDETGMIDGIERREWRRLATETRA